jgi:hypothetical protein
VTKAIFAAAALTMFSGAAFAQDAPEKIGTRIVVLGQQCVDSDTVEVLLGVRTTSADGGLMYRWDFDSAELEGYGPAEEERVSFVLPDEADVALRVVARSQTEHGSDKIMLATRSCP